jgi:hypothetical protein
MYGPLEEERENERFQPANLHFRVRDRVLLGTATLLG